MKHYLRWGVPIAGRAFQFLAFSAGQVLCAALPCACSACPLVSFLPGECHPTLSHSMQYVSCKLVG